MIRSIATAVAAACIAGSAFGADLAVVLAKPKETQVFATGDTPPRLSGRLSTIPFAPNRLAGLAPLASFADSDRLYAAYMGHYLDCGDSGAQAAQRAQWVRQQTLPAQGGEPGLELVAALLERDLMLLAARDGGRAIVLNRATLQRVPGSPCGAAVSFARMAQDRLRIVLVSRDMQVEFTGQPKRLTWNARYTDGQAIHVIDVAPDRPAGATMRTIVLPAGEDVLDVTTPAPGPWQVATAIHGGRWWKPSNWLSAMGGHAERRSTVFLKTYSAEGALVDTQELVADVELFSARFCDQPNCSGEPR